MSTSIDLDNLSDDDDADWVENLVNELNHCQPNNTYIKRQAVQPTRPVDRNGYTLQYGGNENGKRVVQYLEETPLSINKLVEVCNEILIQKKSGLLVWTYFKPYHLECLTYQVAFAIQSDSITTNLVDMVFKCYKMIITSSQKRDAAVPEVRGNKTVPLYTQWVANAGQLMITNLAIIYYFLKKREVPEVPVPPFCKLN